MEWTEGRMEELRALWAAGHSCAEIARRMGGTKNGIVGKAHRMGLPSRPSPIQRKDPARAAELKAEAIRLKAEGLSDREVGQRLGIGSDTAGRILRAAGHGGRGSRRRALPAGAMLRVVAMSDAAIEPPAPIAAHPLVRLGGGCRWPEGDPRQPGFRFCQDPAVVPGKPYCAAHCCRAYGQVERTGGFFALKRIGAAA